MKQVKKIRLTICVLLFFVFSCENKQEIAVEELAKIYVDLLVAEDFYSNTDSLIIKRNSVFEKYGITEQLYDSTFENFEDDREKWESFFKLTNEYLDTLKSNLKSREPKRPPVRSESLHN